MKNSNILTNWCSGISEHVMTRLRPGNNQVKTASRFIAVLCLLFIVGIGNAWGASETFNFSSGSATGSGSSRIITWTGTSCTIVQSKGGSATDVNASYTGTNLRWYQSHDITFTPKSGVTISTIVLTGTSSYKGQTMTERTSTSANISASGNATTVTGSWTSSTPLTLRMGTQFRLTSVVITYSTGASYTVVWTINPAAGGTLSATSGTSTTVTPNSEYTYGSPAYSVTTGTASVSQSTNTFTATPSANCTIRINMVEKPKYTITYNAGSGTCGTAQWAQPSYGASTTLPSATAPATCTGYSFAGWCTSSAGSADENTTSPGTILLSGSSYTPTGDITLYAVYTKTVGGGGSSWVETDFADLTSSDVFVLATPAGYALPSNGGNAKPVVSAITVSAGKITSTVTDGLKWNMSGNSTDGYTFYPNGTTSTWLCCTTTASSGTNDNIRINNSGSRKVWITDSDGDLKTKDTYTDRWLCCYNSADFRGYTASNVTSDIISKCYKYSSGTTYYMTSLVCCTELASINGSFSLPHT